jgi:hypothetical protein
MSRAHIRLLLGQLRLGCADRDVLATQLTAALDGPLLLYLSSATLAEAAQVSERLGRAGRTWSGASAGQTRQDRSKRLSPDLAM